MQSCPHIFLLIALARIISIAVVILLHALFVSIPSLLGLLGYREKAEWLRLTGIGPAPTVIARNRWIFWKTILQKWTPDHVTVVLLVAPMRGAAKCLKVSVKQCHCQTPELHAIFTSSHPLLHPSSIVQDVFANAQRFPPQRRKSIILHDYCSISARYHCSHSKAYRQILHVQAQTRS